MKLNLMKGKCLQLELDWEYLHVIFALLSLIKQYTASGNKEFEEIFFYVESELRKKVKMEAEAERYRICYKCGREIDTKKSIFKREQYESGFETYQCSPTCKPLKEWTPND